MPRIEVKSIDGLKPSSAITKAFRAAADRLYGAYLLDPTPGKRFGIFDRAYTKFVRETESEFEKMAARIHRMWSLPEAVEKQDCLQDLHVEIVRILKNYDPEKAIVAAFLVWNAFARAKKECNRQRGKVKDREPSRHAFPLSGFLKPLSNGVESFEDAIDRLSHSDEMHKLDGESLLDSKTKFVEIFDRLSDEDEEIVRFCLANGGNVRATTLARISPKESALAEEDRKVVFELQTKKVVRALRNASEILVKLEHEGDEQEYPEEEETKPKSERRPKRRKCTDKPGNMPGIEERATEEALRFGGSESCPDDIAAAWAAARRKSRRENEAPVLFLCA